MKTKVRNFVADGIETLGGPTLTANLVGVSNPTVHNWRNAGRITDTMYAVLMEQLTRAAGKPIHKEPAIATWLLGGGNPEDLGKRLILLDEIRRRKLVSNNAPAQNRTGTYGSDEGAPCNLTPVAIQAIAA